MSGSRRPGLWSPPKGMLNRYDFLGLALGDECKMSGIKMLYGPEASVNLKILYFDAELISIRPEKALNILLK
ncbi:hypothetical protein ACFL0H_11955 [Thermodesulfobacteriota bacterium]